MSHGITSYSPIWDLCFYMYRYRLIGGSKKNLTISSGLDIVRPDSETTSQPNGSCY